MPEEIELTSDESPEAFVGRQASEWLASIDRASSPTEIHIFKKPFANPETGQLIHRFVIDVVQQMERVHEEPTILTNGQPG